MSNIIHGPTAERPIIQIRNWRVFEHRRGSIGCISFRCHIERLPAVVELPAEGARWGICFYFAGDVQRFTTAAAHDQCVRISTDWCICKHGQRYYVKNSFLNSRQLLSVLLSRTYIVLEMKVRYWAFPLQCWLLNRCISLHFVSLLSVLPGFDYFLLFLLSCCDLKQNPGIINN